MGPGVHHAQGREHAEQGGAGRSARRRRNRAHRRRRRLLRRAGQVAAGVLPGPCQALGPPPRQARRRRDPAGNRRPGARLVPERPAPRGRGGAPVSDPISYGQAAVLGLLQGVSELFPVSSLGHSVILPQLLGWDIHQNDSFFITFLVATHLATALVLLGFFWRDWVRIVRGLGRSLQRREIGDDRDARLGWLLVVGTVPAGLLGLLLEHALRDVFASGKSAAFFLILNGFML